MFDFIIVGNVIILLFELLVLAGVSYYAFNFFIPRFFNNVNKKIEKENVNKANFLLYLFIGSVFLYIVLEFLNFNAFMLHIMAVIVIAMFVKNFNHPFVLKKWGKNSFFLENVDLENKSLISELNILKEKSKSKKYEYNDSIYVFTSGEFKKQVPTKKDTSKSRFWEGFFMLMIWSFLAINMVYISSVDLESPDILITLVAFVVAYVFSPFYPDLYSTYILAQDEEMIFDSFIEIKVGDKSYFGSIEKLSFFKVQLKDWYNNTKISIFHKLYLGSVVISYPNGKIIEKKYVVTEEDQQKLFVQIPKWFEEIENKNVYEKPILTFFSHNYGYGVKLRINVKVDFLKDYGYLVDELSHLIVSKSNENNIDLRTFDEVNYHLGGNNELVKGWFKKTKN